MSTSVRPGFPRLKAPKRSDGRGTLPRGDRYCRCGSGRLEFFLSDRRGDIFNAGCTLCAPAKHLLRETQIEAETH